jgi:hypothetical protein
MKKYNVIIGIACSALIFTACKKDKENPEISVSNPVEHTHFTAGTSMTVSARFTDDRELASYHAHVADVNGNHVMDFMWESEGDIAGKTFDLTEIVSIPGGLDSVYYLHFEVVDAEGKSTEESIEFHVEP